MDFSEETEWIKNCGVSGTSELFHPSGYITLTNNDSPSFYLSLRVLYCHFERSTEHNQTLFDNMGKDFLDLFIESPTVPNTKGVFTHNGHSQLVQTDYLWQEKQSLKKTRHARDIQMAEYSSGYPEKWAGPELGQIKCGHTMEGKEEAAWKTSGWENYESNRKETQYA